MTASYHSDSNSPERLKTPNRNDQSSVVPRWLGKVVGAGRDYLQWQRPEFPAGVDELELSPDMRKALMKLAAGKESEFYRVISDQAAPLDPAWVARLKVPDSAPVNPEA